MTHVTNNMKWTTGIDGARELLNDGALFARIVPGDHDGFYAVHSPSGRSRLGDLAWCRDAALTSPRTWCMRRCRRTRIGMVKPPIRSLTSETWRSFPGAAACSCGQNVAAPPSLTGQIAGV